MIGFQINVRYNDKAKKIKKISSKLSKSIKAEFIFV